MITRKIPFILIFTLLFFPISGSVQAGEGSSSSGNAIIAKSETYSIDDVIEKRPIVFDTNYHNADVSLINLKESVRSFLMNETIDLYGQVVSDQVMSSKINLLMSDGKYLALNMSGQVIAYIDLVEYLPGYVNKGKNINGGYWINETDVMIYHLSEIENKISDAEADRIFEMSLTWLHIDNEEVSFVDRHTFGRFGIKNVNALGGGMSAFGPGIVLSTGGTAIEFTTNTQDPLSNYGKVIWIDINAVKTSQKFEDENFAILANGLRNPIGIVASNDRSFLIDNGEYGGDFIAEIVPGGNFGRNLYDYGRPYDFSVNLYSDKPDNYIEPLFYFNPAIAPSDISSCPFEASLQGYGNCLIVSSLRAESMFIFKIQKMGELETPYVQSVEQINVGERIRRIETVGDTVFLFTDLLNVYIIKYSLSAILLK